MGGGGPSRQASRGMSVTPVSLLQSNMVAPVLLPARIVVLHAEWMFFPVADRLHSRRVDAAALQVRFEAVRPALPQSNVVFLGPSIVALPFDHNFDGRMLREKRSVARRRRCFRGTDVRLVIVEKDVFHVPGEQVTFRRTRCRRLRDRYVDCHACARVTRSARTLGEQGKRCGIVRTDRVRA